MTPRKLVAFSGFRRFSKGEADLELWANPWIFLRKGRCDRCQLGGLLTCMGGMLLYIAVYGCPLVDSPNGGARKHPKESKENELKSYLL